MLTDNHLASQKNAEGGARLRFSVHEPSPRGPTWRKVTERKGDPAHPSNLTEFFDSPRRAISDLGLSGK
jgi:hypothetical protein